MHDNLTSYNGPLFIIGMPRSGTKLLRGLLNQHPQIAIPAIETEFLPGLINKYSIRYKFTRSEFGDFYKELLRLPYFRYQTERDNLISEDDWYLACNNYSLSGIFEALIRCSTKTVGMNNIVWGDKSPSYISHITLLKEIYPTAKFIHIVRDVRDYVLSMSKAWGKNKLRAAQRWADSLDKAQVAVTKIQNDAIIVKYEELLENHEVILREVLQFLNLPFDKRVLKLSEASENIGDARGETEIISTNKNKYMSLLNDKEILNVERLAGQTLANYGYPVGYKGVRQRLSSPLEKWYQLFDIISLIMFERKNRGVWGSIIFYWNYFRATRGI